MKYVIIAFCLCIAYNVNAIHPEKIKDEHTRPRIIELIPDLFDSLAVEPAIPENFVAMSSTGTISPCDWIYWGPKEVLEKFFKDPDSLDRAVLRVRFESEVAQVDVDTFTITPKELSKSFPDLTSRKYSWGGYPVREFKFTMGKHNEKKKILIAYVGLNVPTGSTLMFNLVYPECRNQPNDDEVALWNNLLKNTKKLSEHDFFKANGQYINPGYTVVDQPRIRLVMTAEKRERDGKIQLVVAPATSDIKFKFERMQEGHMGAQYHHAEPLLKVYGTIIKMDGDHQNIVMEHVTSILIETVSEFSVTQDEVKSKGYLIFQNGSFG